MSKPLIFVIQLIGLVMILSGWTSDPKDYFFMSIGFALAVIGSAGFFARTKPGQ